MCPLSDADPHREEGQAEVLDRTDRLRQTEAKLRLLADEADRQHGDLVGHRKALEELARRIVLLEGRNTYRGRRTEPRTDLDAIEGAVNYLRFRSGEFKSVYGETPQRLTFLTSICPRNFEHQEEAIKSWLRFGDAVSFNSEEEIRSIRAELRARPGSVLACVALNQVSTTALEELGRPYVLIDSLLDFIQANGCEDRAFAITNSDILFELERVGGQEGSFADSVLQLLQAGPVFGSRVEVRDVDLKPAESTLTLSDGTYYWGFDYFLLMRAHVTPLLRQGFVLGQPWWDYYLPFELIDKHGLVFYLENRIAFHIEHKIRWNSDSFASMERRFKDYRQLVGSDIQDGGRNAQDFCREIRRRAVKIRVPV